MASGASMRFHLAFRRYSSQSFRKYCSECCEIAAATENEQHKAMLRNMAQAWLNLAERAERDPPLVAPNGKDAPLVPAKE